MADLITTWLPRVGDTGDDKYAWPVDDVLEAGPSYSTPPLWSELNDAGARGLNQIIGAVNKFKYLNGVGGNGSLGDALDYVVSDSIPLATLFTTLKSAIDAIRSANNQSVFSWTTSTFASNDVALRQTLLEFRKALVLTELWFPQSDYNRVCLYRYEDPMFDIFEEGVYSAASTRVRYDKAGTQYSRWRDFLTPRLSDDAWPEGFTPASLSLPWKAESVYHAYVDAVLELWRIDTDITPVTIEDFDAACAEMVDSKYLTDIAAGTVYNFVETSPERLAVDRRCYEFIHSRDRTNYTTSNSVTYVLLSLNDASLKTVKVALD